MANHLNQLALTKTKKALQRRRLLFVWGMLLLPLIQFAIFYVFVNFNSIILSFQTKTGNFTTIHYKMFFEELIHGTPVEGYVYRDAILYSLALGLNDALLVLLSCVLAYFIYKKIPGRNTFRVAFFLPSIISISIYVLVFRYLLNDESGIPGLLGVKFYFFDDHSFTHKLLVPLYCLWVGTGYNILVLGAAMANIPQEVIENAKLEGVSKVRELFEIILPMIWPTLVVAFVGSISTVFSIFIQVQLLTGGTGGTKTIAYIINTMVENNTNKAAAIGIIFTLISIPSVLLVKYILDKLGKKWGY